MYILYLSGMEVENPYKSSPFKSNNFIIIMFTTNISRALCHEIILLI